MRLAAAVLILLVTACSAAPSTRTGVTDSQQPTTPAARKAITIALEGEINALATELNASAVSGLSSYMHAFLTNTMTMNGDDDEIRPLLTTELPSIEAGTWKVFDDGRMEVTWRLHHGVLWHDGTEFTSADVRFGWQAVADPVALGRSSLTVRQMEDVTTPDPYTVVVHWKETSRFGERWAGTNGRRSRATFWSLRFWQTRRRLRRIHISRIRTCSWATAPIA
jgi:ABC-type transport system substrate-binding protein